MTGREFKTALRTAGLTQSQFADAMGVHRARIASRCRADAVEPFWTYALIGFVAEAATTQIRGLIEQVKS